MATPPVCPSCGSLGVGDHCAQCGTKMKPLGKADEMLTVAAPGLQLDGVEDAKPALVTDKRHRAASAYLALQPSETAVLHAASRIFAGFVANGEVTDANEKELSDRAVRLATRMALVIEKYVQSDDEDW
ncbi:MAG TPA: hypothetical protein VMZ53_09805 [Kofleriaceae bacterium]|nr:hypothetical protein [Kofleriaceae bacterium]